MAEACIGRLNQLVIAIQKISQAFTGIVAGSFIQQPIVRPREIVQYLRMCTAIAYGSKMLAIKAYQFTFVFLALVLPFAIIDRMLLLPFPDSSGYKWLKPRFEFWICRDP